MKKLLGIILSFSLLLGIAGVSLAATTYVQVGGSINMGYMSLPGYDPDRLENITNNNYAYDKGAVFSDFDFAVRVRNDFRFFSGLSVQLLSQMEAFKDDLPYNSESITFYADPVSNLSLTYNPGPVKIMFDLKGQEVVMGSIRYDEPLKLNVARAFAKDNNTRLYLDPRYQAKQLTLVAPFTAGLYTGQTVAVFSLEPLSTGAPGQFVGAFSELNFSEGKVGLGYRAKLDDPNYRKPIKASVSVLAFDYKFASGVRLQSDYIIRSDNDTGYDDYWKSFDNIDMYPETPFKVKQRLKTRITKDNYQFDIHLIETGPKTGEQSEKHWETGIPVPWDEKFAYSVGASYAFMPYTVGFNYRNWAFYEENLQAQEDGYVGELYLKHSLTMSSRDSLKVFYRTDKSCGASVMISLW